jgi:hypothetical protein
VTKAQRVKEKLAASLSDAAAAAAARKRTHTSLMMPRSASSVSPSTSKLVLSSDASPEILVERANQVASDLLEQLTIPLSPGCSINLDKIYELYP